MSGAAITARAIARAGDAMTLNRSGETAIALKGKRIGGMIDALGNTSQQAFRVKIGAVELTASDWSSKAPAQGDTITIDGRVCNVLDARPLKDGTTVALYELEVAG